MTIRKITEIRNAGIWRDFTAPPDLTLAPRSLIFGFNGSGKTTLSRIFASIERGALERRLPIGTSFRIEASDGTIVTETLVDPPFGKNLLVFNTDFVARNFKWDESSTKGIAYLSEEKIDKRQQYEALTADLEKAFETAKAGADKSASAEKALKVFKTRVAKNVCETSASAKYNSQTYNARQIETAYSKRFEAHRKLPDDAILRHQRILAQQEPQPEITFSPNLPDALVDWFRNANDLISQTISTRALDEFEAHPDLLRWAEEGLHYHAKNALSQCLFCGNPFSEERRNQLQKLFDESLTKAFEAFEIAVKDGEAHQESLRKLDSEVPDPMAINADEREAFETGSKKMKEAIKKLRELIGELLGALRLRKKYPTKEITIKDDLANFSLDDWLTRYEDLALAVSESLVRHNSASESLAENQEAAFAKIEAHVLASNQAEWDSLTKNVTDAKAADEETQASIRNLNARIAELHNALQDTGVGADKMNQLIWSYLGHKDLRLVAKDGGYRITRPSGEPATELSEGERTAFAFCYFLTLLEAEGRQAKDLVLVIDDPVSSLDISARTHAFSLLMRNTKKCGQVIILTHSTAFMNMVKRAFNTEARGKDGDGYKAFLSLDCRSSDRGDSRSTVLDHMHPLLVDYESEYHYLFSIVREAAHNGGGERLFILPNAMRKLLEMFAAFCSPDKSSFASALGDHTDTVKEKVNIKALERLVQIGSHGTMDGLQALPDLTIQEADNAAKASMAFIQAIAPNHFKKMVALCTCSPCGQGRRKG